MFNLLGQANHVSGQHSINAEINFPLFLHGKMFKGVIYCTIFAF